MCISICISIFVAMKLNDTHTLARKHTQTIGKSHIKRRKMLLHLYILILFAMVYLTFIEII